MPQEQFLRGLRGLDGELRPGAHHHAGLQRGLDPAQRGRAVHPRRRRSSSCCWATSAAPAAGSSRCAGTPASRARTDIPTLFNLLPGYLPMPSAAPAHDLDDVRGRRSAAASRRASGATPTRTWSRCSRSTGARRATAENDYCFDYLPRIDGDHGTYRTVDGHGRRARCPATSCSARTPRSARRTGGCSGSAMANLDWMVVRDLAMIESATFWKDAPEVETGEIVPEDVPHRGVLLPRRLARGEGGHVHPDPADAAVAGEGRRPGRRPALGPVVLLPPGPDGPGAAGGLGRRARPADAVELDWDYPCTATRRGASRSAEDGAARGSTATTWTTGELVDGYRDLKADGSTSCGLLDLHRGVHAAG